MANRWSGGRHRPEITPPEVYFRRREFMASVAGAGIAGIAGMAGGTMAAGAAQPSDLVPNEWEHITTHNNFYEFGTGKGDPAHHAHALTTSPWTVRIDGLVDRPGDHDLRDIITKMTIEERIYRLRCVEAWSMVIPWNGFELADLLNHVGVRPEARYVAFTTLLRPEEMRGQRFPVLEWPYVDGLRIDEAMHPLTIMATGLYGRQLPNQNGAPIRLVVPWKYGFKSIKSVVHITLVEDEPPCTWNVASPREYGFYSNVNPEVDHPRWSQATERRIGGGLFARRQPTEMFNGYAEEVASLYDGMDLKVHF